MHQDPQGRTLLAAGLIERFVPVEDKHYDPIRDMAVRAGGVTLQEMRTGR